MLHAPMHRLLLILVVCWLSWPALALAQAAAEQNYAKDLRIPPRSPEQSRQAIQTRPGFQVELVAAEPLVRSPIAIDFDEDGRMYVVEYPEYNDYAATRPHGHGAIRRLEDRDGDGRYEYAVEFASDVPFASGILCYAGGVLAASAPDLLYLKDTNGDGKADIRERILTGFERDHAGEAMLNGLCWGLDQNVHLSTGLAGGQVHRVGDEGAVVRSVRNRGVALNPRTRDWWITGGGGQYGLSFDDWGRKFSSSNSSAVWQIMYDDRYAARNPVVAAPAAGLVIIPSGKYTQLFRASPVEPWRIAREALRQRQNSSRERGITSNIFTSATGGTVYRGDAYPPEYRGQFFVGEVANNLVFRARLNPDGCAFQAVRADENAEFLASRDNWFRPVQITGGPDGCLYVVDMCRELIEGADFLPDDLLQQLDPSAGVDRGRIFRIVPDDFQRPPARRLSTAATPELVALLASRDGWHRDAASRLLVERRDAAAMVPLHASARQAAEPLARVHALWVLASLGALDIDEVLAALAAPQAELREQSVLLAERFADRQEVLDVLAELTDDPAIRVRLQLAFSLGFFRGVKADEALARLAKRDAGDTWVNLAIRCSATGERANELVSRLAADQTFAGNPPGRTLLVQLAEQVGAANVPADIDQLLQIAEQLPATEDSLVELLVRSLVTGQPATAEQRSLPARCRRLWENRLEAARLVAVDSKQTAAARRASIQLLAYLPLTQSQDTWAALLGSGSDELVQIAALERLAQYRQAEVASLILAAWPTLAKPARDAAVQTLLARRTWAEALLAAVERGQVARDDIDSGSVQWLYFSAESQLRNYAARVFGAPVTGSRSEIVAAYREALDMPGDAGRGRAVFRARCTSCHRLEENGRALGADLAAIGDRGAASVLLNILDPNREVKPNYQVHMLVTGDGRTLTGLVSGETANSITIHQADGTTTSVLRRDIEALQNTGRSFMPEGLEKQISVREMSDLLAYLLLKK